MKQRSRLLSSKAGLAVTVAIGLALLTAALPSSASATTAANAVIRNTATVNYDDAAGNPQAAVADSVDVTVNLVAATPTLNAPGDNTTPSGIATDYTYTILNNSNGPDTFNLSVAYTFGSGNITGHTEVFRNAGDTANIASIDLGATSAAALAASGSSAITVPNDGVSDASVNGIVAGDSIIIGANTYTVASVVDNATGTSTINLTTNLLANVNLGTQIGELGTFISRTTPTATVNGSTYTLTVSAQDAAATAAAANDDTITAVLVTSALSVTKYVQNVDAIVACGGGSVSLNTGLGAGSIAYCDGGVTGNPGETLEYVIAVSNPAGGAAATNVVISDPVPAFTNKVVDSIALDPGTTTWDATGTDAVDGDFASTVAGTVNIYAGSGGTDAGTGGSLAAGATTYGAFRVTIQP